ncbi:MAG: tRNA glutamyl-Q(34) synthetase GluQRS [Myxococcota bacterium]|nr:tRNA glutamyl-Q(34) synthetase GluQRS [Myxococcota bacterium]
MTIRTRFAPSPTGDLHLGGAWTALASWVLARRAGGTFVLRMEDIDHPRVVRGSMQRIEEDLRWLGLDWDEGPHLQSQRIALYEDAIARLSADGLIYPCDCSRTEIARVASAPHAGDEVFYPGLCRNRDPTRPMKRPPALRVRVPDEVVAFDDEVDGVVTQNLAVEAGDFVLRRGDGAFAYHLAVVVDDTAMGITDVVRGADLLESTPRQIWLARVLGARPPRYAHVPLVVANDGSRLEKRTPCGILRGLREAGIGASRVVGELAHGLGLLPTSAPTSAVDVALACDRRKIAWRRRPWRIPTSLLP